MIAGLPNCPSAVPKLTLLALAVTAGAGSCSTPHRSSSRMVVRRATPEDSGAIATIHVRSWQAAYQGVVPARVLASMSVDQREGIWRQRLEQGMPGTWVIEEHRAVLGWISAGPSRDTDALSSTSELWAINAVPTRLPSAIRSPLGDTRDQTAVHYSRSIM